MFVELTVDAAGRVIQGWCADTAPERLDRPLYTERGGDPPGSRRVRLDLLTTEALEIEDRAKEIAAVIAEELLKQGQIDRAAHELASWKRHRLPVLVRDVEIDVQGPPRPGPPFTPPGIEFRRPTIKPRPPVVTQGPPR
jgi:hypothetical protein